MKYKVTSYLTLVLFIVTLVQFPISVSSNSNLVTYTTIPGAIESTVFSVTANGKDIFVEKFLDISYARFAFSGTANVTVTVNENITSYNISPRSFGITPNVKGKSMTFSLNQFRYIMININDLEKLFIFADDLEENPPQLGDEGVYNIMDYPGIDNTGETLNTKQIQHALDDVSSKPGGGVIYFPDGKYLTGTLHIKSNTTVYLQGGALIQGTTNVDDYPRPLVLQDGTEVLIGTLVVFDQADNSKIIGRGVLNGGGRELRFNGRDAWVTSTQESTNILVEGVILRDPAAFNSHICFSENVTYRRVKVVNDVELPNTDGINVDSSRHIVIEEIFTYASDDPVPVKTHRYTTLVQDAFDITIRNNVLWTKKSALKVGDETFAYNMYDITFENNDIIRADRAIIVYVADGATVSNVSWINNRAEFIGGDTFERIIDMWIRPRSESMNTPGKIQDLVIKDFFIEELSANPSSMEGLNNEHQIRNVYIDNMVVGGQKVTNAEEAKIRTNQYVQNIVFGPVPSLPPYIVPEPTTREPGTFVERNGFVAFEAENYLKSIPKGENEWVLDTEKRGALLEGSMISALKDVQPYTENIIETSPQLNYNVNFSSTGKYYVWARKNSLNTNNDFLYVGVNGQKPYNSNAIVGDINPGGWYWSNVNREGGYATIEIEEPGVHAINVYMGTPTVYFDKMIIMQAPSGDALPHYFSPGRKGMGPRTSEIYPGIPVTIDGVLQNYEVPATEMNGRVLVPMRAIFESLGAAVQWTDPTVMAQRGSTSIELTIDSTTAKINGEEIILDQSPIIINGRTMVPVRFVSEALGEKVEWIGDRGLVQIGNPNLAPPAETGNTIATIVTPHPDGPVSNFEQQQVSGEIIEAQRMTLNEYVIENIQDASAHMGIKTDSIGTASHIFTGEAGTYAVNVVYFDENDGAASFRLFVAGNEVDKWEADEDLGNASPVFETKAIRTINSIELKPGDEIKLEGTASGGEPARVDYLEIIKGYVEPLHRESKDDTAAGDSEVKRFEAQRMTLSGGYSIDNIQYASGSMGIKAEGVGNASFTYDGPDGVFALNVAYFDENDGVASFKLFVSDNQVDNWDADEDLGNASPVEETKAVRTIRNIALKNGDEVRIEGTSDAGEPARVDYIEVAPNNFGMDDGGSALVSNALDPGGKRVEAERMTLRGYSAVANQFASGGSLIKLTKKSGEAAFRFVYDSGIYTVKVGYFDENDGDAEFRVFVGGRLIDEWVANQELGSESPDRQTFTVRTIENVKVSSGETIIIEGTNSGGAPARLDYLDIIF